jgi:hypothetical protein
MNGSSGKPARLSALLLLAAATAHAQQDPRAVQPERPTVATHAYTVAPGYLEIEAGVQVAQPVATTLLSAPVVAKVGIMPRLQLEVLGGYGRTSVPGATIAGLTDLAVALKQRVLDAAPLLHDVSVQGSIKFATGASDVGTGTTDLSLLLISSRPIGKAELDLNAGYTHRSCDGSAIPTSATQLTASLGAPCSTSGTSCERVLCWRDVQRRAHPGVSGEKTMKDAETVGCRWGLSRPSSSTTASGRCWSGTPPARYTSGPLHAASARRATRVWSVARHVDQGSDGPSVQRHRLLAIRGEVLHGGRGQCRQYRAEAKAIRLVERPRRVGSGRGRGAR